MTENGCVRSWIARWGAVGLFLAPLLMGGSARAVPAQPNDPGFALQWNLQMIGAPAAWAKGTGANITIAIVDSGVLSVSTEQPAGTIEVVRLGPGDTMGETGLLAGLPVQVKIVTLTRSVIYRLNKNDVTPLLRDSQEVTHRMCRLLSQRQDTLHKIAMQNAVNGDDVHTTFHWLLDKIHRLHALKF